MLTITDLIAVISLCATFYSLGYVRGKHDSRTQKWGIQSLRGATFVRVLYEGRLRGFFVRG